MTENGAGADGPTVSLQAALKARQQLIPWAADALTMYQTIQQLTEHPSPNASESLSDLISKLQELRRYSTLDLSRHLAIKNGRRPYYLHRVSAHLQQARELVDSEPASRLIDHLSAELQATFNEYGFCYVSDAIYNVGEATQKFDALFARLGRLQPASGDADGTGRLLLELQECQAVLGGMKQAMTQANIDLVAAKFDDADRQISRLQQSCTIGADSELMLHYLACQHSLNTPLVRSLSPSTTTTTTAPDSDVINGHMIHPGTRGWLLERVERWLYGSKRQLFFVAGKPGSGKTAVASALCKLRSHSVVASHFCTKDEPLRSVILSLAADLCRTVPEYLNWFDDKYGSGGDVLKGELASAGWQLAYELLLKEPLRALYGGGTDSSTTTTTRRVLIVDGAERLDDDDWQGFKQMVASYIKDAPTCMALLLTVRTEEFSKLVPAVEYETAEGVGLEDKAWVNRHIKDIEIYLSGSLGAILSGEDEVDAPYRAKADNYTLQNTVDEMLKHSGGRFDCAIAQMEAFATEMSRSSGQFLSSLKKAMAQQPGIDADVTEFSSPYRSYRDKEGRSVDVRVMRQNHYLMDKTRVALIRGRHKIHELNKQ